MTCLNGVIYENEEVTNNYYVRMVDIKQEFPWANCPYLVCPSILPGPISHPPQCGGIVRGYILLTTNRLLMCSSRLLDVANLESLLNLPSLQSYHGVFSHLLSHSGRLPPSLRHPYMSKSSCTSWPY